MDKAKKRRIAKKAPTPAEQRVQAMRNSVAIRGASLDQRTNTKEWVDCWPYGYNSSHGRDCDEKIPDVRRETMQAWGWGWSTGPDPGSATGQGFFYACYDHREDCASDAERAEAKQRNIAMKKLAGIPVEE